MIPTPEEFKSAMTCGELPCQKRAMEAILAGLERTDIFYSEGRVYIGRDRAIPVFRLLAARGWHILWANKWGDGRDLPDQDDGKDVKFVVSAIPPAYFAASMLSDVTTAYRVGPRDATGEIIESGPLPLPDKPKSGRY